MGESLINLSLPSNVNLQGQHTYIDRTTLRQGIKALVFIGLIRINQSQNSCFMITVFTAAKYEIEIECLTSIVIKCVLEAWSELSIQHAEHFRDARKETQNESEILYVSLRDKVASTYLDTRENASEQMAGQGTSLMAMCPRAAG